MKEAHITGELAGGSAPTTICTQAGSDLRGLLSHFDEIRVPGGTVVARAGRFCRQYLVVLDGRLETTTNCGLPTGTIGASCGWDAICEKGVSPTTVYAASDARLLVIGRAQFRAVPIKARGNEQDSKAPAQTRPLSVQVMAPVAQVVVWSRR